MSRRAVVLNIPVRIAIGTQVTGNAIQPALHAPGLAAAWPSRKAHPTWQH
jgi:hypothetical protein